MCFKKKKGEISFLLDWWSIVVIFWTETLTKNICHFSFDDFCNLACIYWFFHPPISKSLREYNILVLVLICHTLKYSVKQSDGVF